MTADFYTVSDEPILFIQGNPENGAVLQLPHVPVQQADLSCGQILLQEISIGYIFLRYFVFRFVCETSIFFKGRNEGLYSLMVMKGKLGYGVQNKPLQYLTARKFLLHAGGNETAEIRVSPDDECHLFNVFFSVKTLEELLPVFPLLHEPQRQSAQGTGQWMTLPRGAHYTVLDTIQTILTREYREKVQRYFWELKLKEVLFFQLAQLSDSNTEQPVAVREQERLEKVRLLIEADISKHYSNDELARRVNWSESSLKRAFPLAYGLGMYEYLRKLRMHKARELLLQGPQVKAVAFTVGMRPSNFTNEFQKYFGYKATSLHRRNR